MFQFLGDIRDIRRHVTKPVHLAGVTAELKQMHFKQWDVRGAHCEAFREIFVVRLAMVGPCGAWNGLARVPQMGSVGLPQRK